MSWIWDLLSRPAVQYAASVAVVFGVQSLVKTQDMTWYKNLKKPSWTPPNWMFPAVWILLKLMQSGSLMLACRAGAASWPASAPALAVATGVFTAHMFLGNWWNVVFFGQHKMQESLLWMKLFWASILGSAAAFKPLSPVAGGLMLPTLVWVTVAWKLNYDFVQLNKDKEAKQ